MGYSKTKSKRLITFALLVAWFIVGCSQDESCAGAACQQNDTDSTLFSDADADSDADTDSDSDSDIDSDTGGDSDTTDDTAQSEDSETATDTDLDTASTEDTGVDSETEVDFATPLIVDVRSSGEYETEHYPGAINIPVGELVARQEELYPKDRAITVYCTSGARATQAHALLTAEGFTNVTNGGRLVDMPAQ